MDDDLTPQTKTWLEMVENDLDFARGILRHRQRPFYAAHFCHQAVEKVLKAIVQQRTGEPPPRTHHFHFLCKSAGIDLPQEMADILHSLSPHYLGTRYPEDIHNLYRQYSEEFVTGLLERTEALSDG